MHVFTGVHIKVSLLLTALQVHFLYTQYATIYITALQVSTVRMCYHTTLSTPHYTTLHYTTRCTVC